MNFALQSVAQGGTRLLPGLFQRRAEVNRRYLMSLDSRHLLQNFYVEAGLPVVGGQGHGHWEPGHLGWESPICQLRGHFLGHWLSAAAKWAANTGDAEIRAKADWIVAELERCQLQNGGEWAGSIPEKYLHSIAEGKQVWAPHYTLHKTLMGLYDMYAFTGSRTALQVMDNWSAWFARWTADLTPEQLADVLDVETGGMMEAWADLYGATGKPEHRELMERYARHRLFDPLLAGEDVLTNMHANTTIPEVHGAARAYEVTGEQRWRDIVEAYWKSAVTDRGSYCTGSQTVGEIWTPPGELSARLGDKNQEHCVVYNMIRLADYLLRWTGDAQYADYIEHNLYNGILAQQHPETGMIAYFLPLQAGARKKWGSPKSHFWCCHGSLVQAHTIHANHIFYRTGEGIAVSQYIPAELQTEIGDTSVRIRMTEDPQTGKGIRNAADETRRPNRTVMRLEVEADRPVEFTLTLRLPSWLNGIPKLTIGEEEAALPEALGAFHPIRRIWNPGDRLRLELPKRLDAVPLPDSQETVAFLDGPVVLAGLCGEERQLTGDIADPGTILVPDNEREWAAWQPGYRTVGQTRGIRFVPLYEVADETYTVYFPVVPKS